MNRKVLVFIILFSIMYSSFVSAWVIHPVTNFVTGDTDIKYLSIQNRVIATGNYTWFFYVSATKLYVKSTSNMVDFSAATEIDSSVAVVDFDFVRSLDDDNQLHLVWANGIVTSKALKYMLITLDDSDGSVSLGTKRDIAASDKYYKCSICVDSGGYPFVGVDRYHASTPASNIMRVYWSTTKDGTWTNHANSPVDLRNDSEAGVGSDGSAHVVGGYGNNVVAITAATATVMKSYLYNGTAWGTGVDMIADRVNVWDYVNAVGTDEGVYCCFSNTSNYDFELYKYTVDDGWTNEGVVLALASVSTRSVTFCKSLNDTVFYIGYCSGNWYDMKRYNYTSEVLDGADPFMWNYYTLSTESGYLYNTLGFSADNYNGHISAYIMTSSTPVLAGTQYDFPLVFDSVVVFDDTVYLDDFMYGDLAPVGISIMLIVNIVGVLFNPLVGVIISVVNAIFAFNQVVNYGDSVNVWYSIAYFVGAIAVLFASKR